MKAATGKALVEEKEGARRACPACGSAAALPRGRKSGFDLLSCRACGTLYAPVVPEDLGSYYDDYYDPSHLESSDFIARRLDQIMAEFAPYRKINRMLDIGSGAGTILEAARRAGWEAEGVEVSRTAVEHVRGLGFKVHWGEVEGAGYPDGYFDVVTASEVIEHVADPQLLLNEIARVLRPGGLLWATTPHGRGVAARVMGLDWENVIPPNHLQLFSSKGVRTLLNRAGFRRSRIATQGMNPFEVLRYLRHRPRAGANAAGDGGDDANGGGAVEQQQQTACEGGQAGHLSSQELNERLSQSPVRRMTKGVVNKLLNVSRLGDSLKIWAEN